MTVSAPEPVFDFMMVRPPEQVGDDRARAGYITDTVFEEGRGVVDVDLQAAASPSAIGRLVYERVFCEPYTDVSMDQLQFAVLALLGAYEAQCGDGKANAAFGGDNAALFQLERAGVLAGDPPSPLDIHDLERHSYLRVASYFFLLPDRLEGTSAPLANELLSVLAAAVAVTPPADPATYREGELVKQVTAIFAGKTPAEVVFNGPVYVDTFRDSKRILFDELYILYVLRRWVNVDFQPIMDGLRALHLLEALAVDEIYQRAVDGTLTAADFATMGQLSRVYPRLGALAAGGASEGFPLLASAAAVAERLSARPVVHPLFAQLFAYVRPFNLVNPVGIGDLKVVKQSLIAYEAGEIADIHNVMKGERMVRDHRRIEKSTDVFSTTSTSSQDSTTDTSSTDRFEMKREAENVVKTDLSVNANVHAQYDNKVVLVSVGAGFAYNRTTSDTAKSAQNFSREVISKAVDRVTSSTTTLRSTTLVFETREDNNHTFDNTANGATHESGIFRWVNKRYRSQVYNYGKRLMFEFVLPEPAALYVQSRLRYYESNLVTPTMPTPPVDKMVDLGFGPADIVEAKFAELSKTVDLSQFTYPRMTKVAAVVNQATSANFFSEPAGIDGSKKWWSKSYGCRVSGATGYEITQILWSGAVHWSDFTALPALPATWVEHNFVDLSVNGDPLIQMEKSDAEIYTLHRPENDTAPAPGPYRLDADDVMITIGGQNLDRFEFELSFVLTFPADAVLAWQTQVWKACQAAAQAAVDQANQEAQTQYQAAMITYENELADIKQTAVHSLIQGHDEVYNQDLITTELRRQCLALLTKEFDDDPTDDLLTSWESMGSRPVTIEVERLGVTDGLPVQVAFSPASQDVEYPLLNLARSKGKGRYIQFLEQAFEWTRMGYQCYPYFWATPPKWMDLMGRLDDSDPQFTAFLRAGAVHVLVAATPAYDDAVLHFLATREPWDGGAAPAIGDPLYLPISEELHETQDDLYGGTPDGEPWEFTLPTSLVYLDGSASPLPILPPPP